MPIERIRTINRPATPCESSGAVAPNDGPRLERCSQNPALCGQFISSGLTLGASDLLLLTDIRNTLLEIRNQILAFTRYANGLLLPVFRANPGGQFFG